MKAMGLKKVSSVEEESLELVDVPEPVPMFKQILVKISACGVCHTELDEIEGRLPPSKFPMILGHEIVGEVESLGLGATKFKEGDRVVINAIRKITPIPELDYAEHLLHEKEVKSVANVTRRDAQEFLPLAAEIPIVPEVREFKLEEANEALILLKEGKIRGAGVLKMPE